MLTGDVPFKGDNQVAVAMKHVREELPDVQIRRPEVSAALAAVLDRATAKELDRRYPDAASLIADLEDVLAIETSRNLGQVTGEATAVLKSLPAGTRKRLPLRARRSTKAIGALVAIGGDRRRSRSRSGSVCSQTERGTGKRENVAPAAELQSVGLGQRAAVDFDPLGDKREHPDETSAVVDGIRSSTWSTETLPQPRPAEGRRRHRDRRRAAASPRAAWTCAPRRRASRRRSTSPRRTCPRRRRPRAGPRSPRRARSARRESFDLDTDGRSFRRYLVWITKLPPEAEQARRSPRSCCSAAIRTGSAVRA